MDYSFMKTGRGAVEQQSAVHASIALRVEACVWALMERSLNSAAEYVKLANRNAITEEDVRISVKYEATQFLQSDEWERDVEEWIRVMEQVDAEESADDDKDEEDDDEEDEEEDDEEDEDPFCRAEHGEKALAMNAASDGWESYEPQDPVLRFVKQALDKALSETDRSLL
jgi:histone H3/H4